MRRSWTRTSVGVLVVATLGGCATGPGRRGYPTEVVADKVEVFYATDRTLEGEGDGVRYSGIRGLTDPGRPYHLGICHVDIKRERNHDKPAPLPSAMSSMLDLASTTPLDEWPGMS